MSKFLIIHMPLLWDVQFERFLDKVQSAKGSNITSSEKKDILKILAEFRIGDINDDQYAHQMISLFKMNETPANRAAFKDAMNAMCEATQAHATAFKNVIRDAQEAGKSVIIVANTNALHEKKFDEVFGRLGVDTTGIVFKLSPQEKVINKELMEKVLSHVMAHVPSVSTGSTIEAVMIGAKTSHDQEFRKILDETEQGYFDALHAFANANINFDVYIHPAKPGKLIDEMLTQTPLKVDKKTTVAAVLTHGMGGAAAPSAVAASAVPH